MNFDFILRSIRSFVQVSFISLVQSSSHSISSISGCSSLYDGLEITEYLSHRSRSLRWYDLLTFDQISFEFVLFIYFLDASFDEIERILLLLLACSISGGDRKEFHIEHLTNLNESIQQSLMPRIEELTEEINSILQPQEFAFDETFNTMENKYLQCLFINLNNLIEERDHYFEEILELEQDKESLKEKLDLYQSSSNNLMPIGTGTSNLHSTPSQTSLNTFLNDLETKNPGIEISDYKTKMRQIKCEL